MGKSGAVRSGRISREDAWGELLDLVDDSAMRALLRLASEFRSGISELRVQAREEKDLLARRMDELERWVDQIEHQLQSTRGGRRGTGK